MNLFKCYTSHSKKEIKTILEVPFPVLWNDNKERRRSDVTVFDESQHPLLIFEVKMEDELSEDQLDDYIKYALAMNAGFILITKYPAEDWICKTLKTKMSRQYDIVTINDLYKNLRRLKSKGLFQQEFIKYLEESCMIYNQILPQEVGLFLQSLFLRTSQQNRATTEKITRGIPYALEIINSNLEFLGNSVREKIEVRYKKRMVVSVLNVFEPFVTKETLEKLLKVATKDEDHEVRVKKYSNEIYGYYWFFCSLQLNDNIKYVGLEFGYVATVEKGISRRDVVFKNYVQLNPDPDGASYLESPHPLKYKQNKGWDAGDEIKAFDWFYKSIKVAAERYLKHYKMNKNQKFKIACKKVEMLLDD
ncbi:hypothetical protein Dole_0242 [Desulfosudis oleivorans Hxd3]|uniref:Uncharacterized protein n=1 Tax=Desulfosudis oleivorans (strain DSM 6200 / JCM 39069 / Hxd3) TaxID=96561 RepID=A8ZS34_DESOH|nr:hypothetical protein Dole_0242 [Desulfosudis oleivorans Hxd3]